MCENDFKFYFLMVTSTKIIAQFIECNFLGLKMNEAFESELFIILMHAVIGSRIGVKTYKIVRMKFEKKKGKKMAQ